MLLWKSTEVNQVKHLMHIAIQDVDGYVAVYYLPVVSLHAWDEHELYQIFLPIVLQATRPEGKKACKTTWLGMLIKLHCLK